MIISAVTDPSIFGPDSIIDDLVKREALHLLEAIRVNGLLIVDTDRELLEEALRFATALSTKMGQRIVRAALRGLPHHGRRSAVARFRGAVAAKLALDAVDGQARQPQAEDTPPVFRKGTHHISIP